MKTHEENLQLFLQLGGSEKVYRLYVSPTLANRAKIQAKVKELQRKNLKTEVSEIPIAKPTKLITEASEPQTVESTPSHALLGVISEYPVELHAAYLKAFECWLNACSLKVKLNQVAPKEEKEAYGIQSAIYSTMQEFDRSKKALDYYKENRSILPTECKADLSAMSPLELDRRLRNLRPLITRRRQTIETKQKELPPPDDAKYHARISIINKKIEALETFELEAREIEKILKEKLK